MQNHPIRGLLLASLVLAACSDNSSPTLSPASGLHGGNSSISGQVNGLTFGPDSTAVKCAEPRRRDLRGFGADRFATLWAARRPRRHPRARAGFPA
jgi:hypothetical protein